MIVFQPPTTHPQARWKVVLLSGLSDPASTALSRSQHDFLDRLDLPAASRVDANFPYLPADRPEQRSVPLVLASWRNFRQFRGAARSPYRDRAAAHWDALARSCDGLLVITLSCGLEILNACLQTGHRPQAIDVVALGPVAWGRPPVSHLLVRGARDPIANPWFRECDLWIPGVGHLDYLQSPAVLDLVRERLGRLRRTLEATDIRRESCERGLSDLGT